MSNKLKNSWFMVKASAQVLKSDKELVVFPIISSLAVILISISFAIPVFSNGNLDKSSFGLNTSNLPIVFAYYFLIYFVIIFFNSALVSVAIIKLKGGSPTLGDGIKIASGHIKAIIGYALISSTVGIILRWAQEKLGIFGKIFTFLSSFAWNLVTFLVIPILVTEGIGPIEAVKRSSHLLKKTWGEQLIGNIGIGLLFGLLVFGLLILFLPLAIYTSTESMHIVTISLGVIFGIVVLMLIITASTLNTIYTAALYRYASEGIISENFDENILRNSFKQK